MVALFNFNQIYQIINLNKVNSIKVIIFSMDKKQKKQKKENKQLATNNREIEDNEKNEDKNEQTQSLKNIQFYNDVRASQPHGDKISKILAKWNKNYELLEKHHGFIQWLFPNKFQSRFNPLSQPLNQSEIKQFMSNKVLAKRYVDAYVMMLEFYGMKIKDKKTGEIVRSRNPNFYARYQATLIGSFHNHMRITRILSSLVCLGFGRYAKQLSLFLRKQINYGPMKCLKNYGIYERQWKQYSEYIEKESQTNLYLKELDKK